MINLATCNRPEMTEAYQEAIKERDYWREFAHDLEIKLQEYEGVKPTQEEAKKEFEKFWSAYGRKGNLKQTRRRWFNLSNKKRALAMDKVVAYVKSTPDKQFRKGGEAWLLNECWNDEIVDAAQHGRHVVRVATSFIEDREAEEKRLQEAAKLRRASRGRNVRDILK